MNYELLVRYELIKGRLILPTHLPEASHPGKSFQNSLSIKKNLFPY